MRHKGLQMQMESGIFLAGANINIFVGEGRTKAWGPDVDRNHVIVNIWLHPSKNDSSPRPPREWESWVICTYTCQEPWWGGGGRVWATRMWPWPIPPATLLACLGQGLSKWYSPWNQKSGSQLCQGTSYSQGFSWEPPFSLIEIQKTVEPSQSSCEE